MKQWPPDIAYAFGWVPKPLNTKARERLLFESGLTCLLFTFCLLKRPEYVTPLLRYFTGGKRRDPRGREPAASRHGPGLGVNEFGGLE